PKLGTSWDDVAIVRATIVDAAGIPVPNTDDLISFSVTGPGVIAAVDNGDNDSHEPFQVTARRAYYGACAAFVKFSSQVVYHHHQRTISVTATAAGLKSGSINLLSAE
ncbi:MAG: beta-galactosidase, partial [Verrucomicrobia bacterium]|nr:beta-galactosidase [Verrucomicrobiota bacterium]